MCIFLISGPTTKSIVIILEMEMILYLMVQLGDSFL